MFTSFFIVTGPETAARHKRTALTVKKKEVCRDDNAGMVQSQLPTCKHFVELQYCSRFAPLAHDYCPVSCGVCSSSDYYQISSGSCEVWITTEIGREGAATARPPPPNAQTRRPPPIPLANVGRESHTYLYHITANYETLAKRTVFMQDREPSCGFWGGPVLGGHLLLNVSVAGTPLWGSNPGLAYYQHRCACCSST